MIIYKLKTIVQAVTFFLLVMLIPVAPHALPGNKIIKSEYHRNKNCEIITIFLNNQPEFDTYILHEPQRIVVDIKKSFFPKVHYSEAVHSTAINAIRISQNRKDLVRVVLDMQKKIEYKAEYKKTAPGNQHTISIIVAKQKNSEISSPPPLFPETNQKKRPGKNQENPAISSSKPHSLLPETNQKKVPAKNQEKYPEANQEDPVFLFDTDMPEDIFDKPKKDSGFSISGIIQARGAADTHNDPENEHGNNFRNRVIIETEYKKNFTISAISDYLVFGNENHKDDYDIKIHEAFYRYAGNSVKVTAGKQIIRWGKTDQISPVDTLNPEDMREFIIPEYEDRKIPVWMADIIFHFTDFSVEGVYIPVFENSEIDYFGSDWAIFSHTKNDINDSSIPDIHKAYFNNIQVHETAPHDHGLNGEYAFKISGTTNGWDIGATYHYAWEDFPYFKSFPVKNINVNGSITEESLVSSLDNALFTMEKIETKYLRTSITGLFFETTISDFGFRGEAAWQNKESFLTSSLTSVTSPTLFYIIGADYTSPTEWYINLQAAHRHIFNHDPSTLYFKKDTFSLLGEISKDLYFTWLKAALHYNITLNDNEYYLSPRLKYTYITNLTLLLGANIFEGRQTSFIGRFDQDDQFFIDLKYLF